MRAFCRASRADAASLGPSPHRTGMVADLETASRLGPAGELAGMTQCELRATSPKPGRRTPDKIDKSKSKVSPQLRPWNLFSRDTAFIQQRDEGFSEVLATIEQIGLFMFQPPQENQLPVAGVVRHSTKSKVGFDFSNRHFTRCNLLKEPIPVFLQHKAHVVGPTRSRFSPTVNITEETLEWRFYVWLTPRQNSEVNCRADIIDGVIDAGEREHPPHG